MWSGVVMSCMYCVEMRSIPAPYVPLMHHPPPCSSSAAQRPMVPVCLPESKIPAPFSCVYLSSDFGAGLVARGVGAADVFVAGVLAPEGPYADGPGRSPWAPPSTNEVI